MLEIEFAATLRSRTRYATTTRIILGTLPANAGAGRSRTAGFSRWPTAWADTNGRGRFAHGHRTLDRRLSRCAGRRSAHPRCCSAWCRRPTSRCTRPGGRPVQAASHGNHHRGLRPALRSRGRRARGRFPLLSDPPWPRHCSSRATIPWSPSRCGWDYYRRAKRPRPNTRHMLSRSLGNDLFVNVEIGDHQVHPGRRPAALFGRSARLCRRCRDRRTSSAAAAILNAAAQKLVALANDGTAAIISVSS